MNPTLDVPPIIPTVAPPRTVSENVRAAWAKVWKAAVFGWKYFLGMVFCQSVPGAILIVGWTYRLMQRCIYKRWWQRSELRKNGTGFREFLSQDESTHAHVKWPNWIVEQNFAVAVRRNPIRALVHSSWVNFKLGVQGIFNTWVLTMPGCVLMAFSWYDGWNNSFNKGYEQAAVGPLLGIFGLFLFMLAMLYVPLAQARQAATGQWHSFYQFRLIWRIALRRWLASLVLAMLYSVFSIPLMVLRVMPEYFPQMDKHTSEFMATLTQKEIVDRLNSYFFMAALVILPAYVILRVVAARIYATGLLGAVEQGVIALESLAENERTQLGRLGLLEVHASPQRHILLRLAGKGINLGFWSFATGAMLFIWFTFVAQVYIGQFLNYQPGLWLNHPLVQLPVFHFIPAGLN